MVQWRQGSSIRNRIMRDQRVMGKRKNNPVAQQLSDPLWKMKVVKSRVLYTRKLKHKEEQFNDKK